MTEIKRFLERNCIGCEAFLESMVLWGTLAALAVA